MIYFSKKTEKYLDSLPPRIAFNIISKIEKIPLGDIRPLSGMDRAYRLRAGKFRILFFIDGEDIKVFKVDKRGDVYKK